MSTALACLSHEKGPWRRGSGLGKAGVKELDWEETCVSVWQSYANWGWVNRCSPNANVTHGVLLWADFLHQHKSFGKQLSLEELVAILLGHWGSAQPELSPAPVARLKHFAQTLLKCLKPALPIFASPWQGGCVISLNYLGMWPKPFRYSWRN